jgi:hypothetical protein
MRHDALAAGSCVAAGIQDCGDLPVSCACSAHFSIALAFSQARPAGTKVHLKDNLFDKDHSGRDPYPPIYDLVDFGVIVLTGN